VLSSTLPALPWSGSMIVFAHFMWFTKRSQAVEPCWTILGCFEVVYTQSTVCLSRLVHKVSLVGFEVSNESGWIATPNLSCCYCCVWLNNSSCCHQGTSFHLKDLSMLSYQMHGVSVKLLVFVADGYTQQSRATTWCERQAENANIQDSRMHNRPNTQAHLHTL